MSPQHRAPSRVVRVTGWLGVGSVLPYLGIKSYWALGGTAGVPQGFDMAQEFEKNGAPAVLVWMQRHGLDFTAVLALMGIGLIWALSRPRSAGPPRRLLLVLAWPAALFFLPYGFLTAVVAATGGGATGAPPFTPWLTVAGVVAFCGMGASLAVCAWLQRHTGARPHASSLKRLA